ncbi:MAG TPA: hypothetical protein VF765_12270 [Polyangiaceae bacterium]
MPAHFIFSFGIAALALAAGCTSSTGGSTPRDAGTDHDVEPDTGSDAGSDGASDAGSPAQDAADAPGEAATVCNMLANSASVITVQQVSQDAPMPQGGTMVDGTYAMTDVSIYTGPTGPSGPSGMTQTTIQIAGSTIQIASNGQPPTRTVTLATSGTSFTATDTCPDSHVTHGSYTATATTILIFLDGGTDDAGARTVVETFTKQ